MTSQDQHFLDQVKKLANSAKLTLDEAENFKDMIEDPALKKQAQNILDTI